MDQKDVYDIDIHPLIERITLICKQQGIPMFCTFQDGEKSFRTTCVNSEQSRWDKIRLMYYLHQTWDIDEFLRKLVKDARENGHDSTFLKAMGIPEKPERRIKNEDA